MIDTQAFNQQLTDGSHPFAKTYLFYGQTPFLSEESAQLLVETAKNHGFPQREIYYIDNKAKFQPILNSLQSPGLFDPQKIIELRFDTDKPSKKIGEKVAEIAKHQSANIVIIQAGHLPYRLQKETWFKQLLSLATPVVAKTIYPNQLANWIAGRAKQLNITLAAAALKAIMRHSEGNLLWTNQILMQLANSDYSQPISEAVVTEMLTDLSVFQIDDLLKALLAKDRQALKITQKLEHENESLVYITNTLYREFGLLFELSQSGESLTQAMQSRRIWQSKQRQYQKACHHYHRQHLQHVLMHLAELDKINKGQSKGDGWLTLSQLVSDLVLAS